MDHPVKEIRPVIKALTQGSPEEQERAVKTYFLPEAAFVHPFCRVPSFAEYQLPLVGYTITSQWLILMIYRWYRILSPHIDIEIYSAVHNQKSNLLYLQIRQVFTFFFFPYYHADVKLTTILRLESRPVGPDGKTPLPAGASPSTHSPASSSRSSSQQRPANAASDADTPANSGRRAGNQQSQRGGQGQGSQTTRFFIACQEDCYQTTEFLKFVVPWFGAPLALLWQLFSTFLCVAGALALAPISWWDVRGGGEDGEVADKED